MSHTNETDNQRGWNWLDVVAVAVMLIWPSIIVADVNWREYHDETLLDERKRDTMGFIIASVGLRLLVRRRFHHNARASEEYSDGIRLMRFGVLQCMAVLLLLPLFKGILWWVVVLVLPLYVVGLALVISGYVRAFVRATMMVLGLGPSADEDQSDANGLINANDLINADEHDVRCYGA